MTRCTKCDIVWRTLWTGGPDDDIEFCPHCKSSLDLEPSDDFQGFIMCQFTGRIYDGVTGKELVINQPVAKVYPVKKQYSETYDEYNRRCEVQDDNCIDRYNQLLGEGKSHQDAWWQAKQEFPPVTIRL